MENNVNMPLLLFAYFHSAAALLIDNEASTMWLIRIMVAQVDQRGIYIFLRFNFIS